jgi:hypothetical protein
MATDRREQDKGFIRGACVAAAIAAHEFGQTVIAEEVLGACGISRRVAVAAGVEEYDLHHLRGLWAPGRKRNKRP